MSNGDGRGSLKFLSERENQQNKRRKKPGADEFAQVIARIAVAQVCESLGFQSFQQCALDSLADVGVRFIKEIGKAASWYANLANRSECNVFDIIQGLEDLAFAPGFSGASDVNRSLSRSGVIKDIISYVAQADENRFVYLTPIFPVGKERTLNPSFSQAEETPPYKHIPSWLPKFPDPRTYTNLSSRDEKDLETEVTHKIEPVHEKHSKVERPMLFFQQKIVHNGFGSDVIDHGEASRSQRAEESNPYLAPSLQYGVKEVIVPIVPALPAKFSDDIADHGQSNEASENNLTSSEPTVRPHATVGSCLCEPGDREEVLLNGRPVVQFKFRNSKKPLRMMTGAHNEVSVSVWFGDDYEGSNEMKRQANKTI